MGRSQSADCQHSPHRQPPDSTSLPKKSASRAPRTPARPHNPSVPSQGGAQGLAILSRRKRDEREGGRTSMRTARQKAFGPQAASRRAASVGPPSIKGDGQGTRAVPGIGFARLRPARRRLCRQGVKSAAGPEDIQADSSRSDISCGATTRSRNTVSQRSPGLAPGAPPALPAPPGNRRPRVMGDG